MKRKKKEVAKVKRVIVTEKDFFNLRKILEKDVFYTEYIKNFLLFRKSFLGLIKEDEAYIETIISIEDLNPSKEIFFKNIKKILLKFREEKDFERILKEIEK
ncbi:MAG: hypothetical protein LRZ94_00440 [Candidatus Pacebacteria bacterium]|nr:hypothetical protein [Candidatus Paceibacterota bacterium]